VSVRLFFDDGAFVTPYLETVIPRIKQLLGSDLEFQVIGMFQLMGNTITAALSPMLRMHNFPREFEATRDIETAVDHTLRSTEQALLS